MLIFDGIIYSIQKYGGITTYFNELINGVAKSKGYGELLLYNSCESNFHKNIKINKTQPRFLERYRNLSVEFSGNTLLHSSYYRISKAKNVKNVITVYDFTYEKFSSVPARFIHKMQKSNALNHADAILCISESTKQDLLYYYPKILDKKIFVTHLANSDSFYSISELQEKKYVRPYILFVGARSGYKNFKVAVEAVARIADLRLIFVGGGKVSDLEKKMLDTLLKDRYEHKGNISIENLNILYNEAIALLYPSQYEGFGIPILEAMAAGCSVIASNVSSIPEVSGDSAILLNFFSSDEIQDALLKLLSKNLNERYIKLGKERVKNFGWDKTVQKTIEIYNML